MPSRLEYGEPKAARLFKVRLVNGRDDGGYYWGDGPPVWCLKEKFESQHFFRADKRATALAHFLTRWPDLEIITRKQVRTKPVEQRPGVLVHRLGK